MAPIKKGKGRVLVMDDDLEIRILFDQMLNVLGYDVESVDDGSKVISLYNEAMDAGSPFLFVILDLTVRGGTGGAKVVKQLIEIDPQVKAIASSGYSNDEVMSDYKRFGFSAIISKPFTISEVSEVFDSLIGENEPISSA